MTHPRVIGVGGRIQAGGSQEDQEVGCDLAAHHAVHFDFRLGDALENAGAMLKVGSLLLTNDRLPEVSGGSMHRAGITDVRYDTQDASARDAVGWYEKGPAH